jgi:hypothetical protein
VPCFGMVHLRPEAAFTMSTTRKAAPLNLDFRKKI